MASSYLSNANVYARYLTLQICIARERERNDTDSEKESGIITGVDVSLDS